MLLVIIACLASSPDECRPTYLQVERQQVMMCLRSAPPVIAEWANEHPGFIIKNWKCEASS